MKLLLLFLLSSTFLIAEQLPGEKTLIPSSEVKYDQNKNDSMAMLTVKEIDTAQWIAHTEITQDPKKEKQIPKTNNQKLYPAVGTLDKAFLMASDYCTTTLQKWDQFLQSVITKINDKLRKDDDEESSQP